MVLERYKSSEDQGQTSKLVESGIHPYNNFSFRSKNLGFDVRGPRTSYLDRDSLTGTISSMRASCYLVLKGVTNDWV